MHRLSDFGIRARGSLSPLNAATPKRKKLLSITNTSLMSALPPLFLDLAIILVTAGIITVIFK
ncbi:MAG: hypothetical protein IJM88_00400 [Bacteroidales bacterium]|nr:hypothetical protein [Bacteroidales bacterium]